MTPRQKIIAALAAAVWLALVLAGLLVNGKLSTGPRRTPDDACARPRDQKPALPASRSWKVGAAALSFKV